MDLIVCADREGLPRSVEIAFCKVYVRRRHRIAQAEAAKLDPERSLYRARREELLKLMQTNSR